jgi:hypothetical protein
LHVCKVEFKKKKKNKGMNNRGKELKEMPLNEMRYSSSSFKAAKARSSVPALNNILPTPSARPYLFMWTSI